MNMRDYEAEIAALEVELARKRITPDMELFVRQVRSFASELWARSPCSIHLVEVVVREVPNYSIDNPQPLNEHVTLEIQTVQGTVTIRLRPERGGLDAVSAKASDGV
jgi:hypothetical protein